MEDLGSILLAAALLIGTAAAFVAISRKAALVLLVEGVVGTGWAVAAIGEDLAVALVLGLFTATAVILTATRVRMGPYLLGASATAMLLFVVYAAIAHSDMKIANGGAGFWVLTVPVFWFGCVIYASLVGSIRARADTPQES